MRKFVVKLVLANCEVGYVYFFMRSIYNCVRGRKRRERESNKNNSNQLDYDRYNNRRRITLLHIDELYNILLDIYLDHITLLDVDIL